MKWLSASPFNWLDVILTVVVAVSLVTSFLKGATREIVSLAALVAGVVAALWWHPVVAERLRPYASSPSVAGFAGFLLILAAFWILGWIISGMLARAIKAGGLRWFDRLLGAAFGLVRGVLAAAALVLAIVAFAKGPEPIGIVASSRVAPVVLQAARVIVAIAPRPFRDGFEDGMRRVRRVWQREAPADAA